MEKWGLNHMPSFLLQLGTYVLSSVCCFQSILQHSSPGPLLSYTPTLSFSHCTYSCSAQWRLSHLISSCVWLSSQVCSSVVHSLIWDMNSLISAVNHYVYFEFNFLLQCFGIIYGSILITSLLCSKFFQKPLPLTLDKNSNFSTFQGTNNGTWNLVMLTGISHLFPNDSRKAFPDRRLSCPLIARPRYACFLLSPGHSKLAFIICLLFFIPNVLLSVHFHWNLLGPCWWLGALLLSVMTSPLLKTFYCNYLFNRLSPPHVVNWGW